MICHGCDQYTTVQALTHSNMMWYRASALRFCQVKKAELKQDFIQYKQDAVDVAEDEELDVLKWHWQQQLPGHHGSSSASLAAVRKRTAYYFVARLVVLVQPTSACVERVFSLLNNIMYSTRQTRTLNDNIAAALMLITNKRHL